MIYRMLVEVVGSEGSGDEDVEEEEEDGEEEGGEGTSGAHHGDTRPERPELLWNGPKAREAAAWGGAGGGGAGAARARIAG